MKGQHCPVGPSASDSAPDVQTVGAQEEDKYSDHKHARQVRSRTFIGVATMVCVAGFTAAANAAEGAFHSEMAGKFLLVAAGATVGATARYALQASYNALWPHGTLLANLTGCFLAGLLSPYFHIWPAGSRLLLLSGFLGALTTLSSFSLETVLLLQKHKTLMAVQYLLVTVGGSLVACMLGMGIGSRALMR